LDMGISLSWWLEGFITSRWRRTPAPAADRHARQPRRPVFQAGSGLVS